MTLSFPVCRDIKRLLKVRLSRNIFELIALIGRVADETGFSAYLVGGFVRDFLLYLENTDLDIVLEGDGIIFAQRLAEKVKGNLKTHKRFGTATFILPDGFKIDLATARKEDYKEPAALPKIKPGSIKDDLFRRDFTINTLAVRLNGGKTFSLLDFFGGEKDLQERRIRVLHDLSFRDDPSRIFRAIRFEQRFDFRLARPTLALLKKTVKERLPGRLSGKRILTELSLILQEQDPLPQIKRMAEFDLLKFIHPRIKLDNEIYKLFVRIKEVICWHNRFFPRKKIAAWFIYFMGLTSELKDKELKEICARLPLAVRYRNELLKKEIARKALISLAQNDNLSPAQIYEILKPFPRERILLLIALSKKNRDREYISTYLSRLISVKIELNGHDLKRIGIKPGPIFKEILKGVKEARLNGEVQNKKEEMEFVRKKWR